MDKENVVYLYGYSNQISSLHLLKMQTYEEVVAKLGGKEVVKNIAAAKSPSMYNIDKLRQSLPFSACDDLCIQAVGRRGVSNQSYGVDHLL